jgi:2-polyprenyl-3-methyl-5-hydroxy-6-metoxy-1,4-benzoquinol methylase
MIDKIIKIYSETDFDFRVFSNPGDELCYLFDEWVPYYKMKYAICKVINPQSILEVGVRYGYSAIAFLKASPEATYQGIDNDTNSYGGTKGAIDWAKKITAEFKTNFLLANTQEMTKFPGEFYDFVHIDGQQDGDGTAHDLEMALKKGRWVLVDGFFWSMENMLSTTNFLKKYKQFIEYAIIIPSYGGDLLIKTKDSARNIRICGEKVEDDTIVDEYDLAYFLQDCGGYDSFKKYQGRRVTDDRLLAALYLSAPIQNASILDIGCGRGELCYALLQAGASVTGIDYSPSAISIAEQTFREVIRKDTLEFICDDFLKYTFDKKFDRIIATDFIEHIGKKRCELVISKVAELLNQNGLFIIHTSPNAMNYETPYQQKRAIARSIGCYLPKNPRTHYEDVMHINEQTPDSLKKVLEKHFPYSIVWVSTPPDIVGSLGRAFSMNEIVDAHSIFAVASASPLEHSYIINQLVQSPLDAKKLNAKIAVGSYPDTLAAGEHFFIEVTLHNLSDERWVSLAPNPVHLSYHWQNEKGNFAIFEGIRTKILYPLLPGENKKFLMEIIAPETYGNNILQITLVQEECFWFEKHVQALPVSHRIKTKPNE